MTAGASSVRQCRHRNDSGSGSGWCCFRADYANLGNHSEAEADTVSIAKFLTKSTKFGQNFSAKSVNLLDNSQKICYNNCI